MGKWKMGKTLGYTTSGEEKRMQMIIISGPPGSGKTSIRRRIVDRYPFAMLSKDDFKELLFDGLGWSDRSWSQKVGGVSYDLLQRVSEELCKTGRPFILESNFTPRLAAAITNTATRYAYLPLVIHCVAEGSVLVDRFRARAQSGTRHPGHQDIESLLEFEAFLGSDQFPPPNLGGPCLTVDTGDFAEVSYPEIFAFIDAYVTAP